MVMKLSFDILHILLFAIRCFLLFGILLLLSIAIRGLSEQREHDIPTTLAFQKSPLYFHQNITPNAPHKSAFAFGLRHQLPLNLFNKGGVVRDDLGALGERGDHVRVGGAKVRLELGPHRRDLLLKLRDLAHEVAREKVDCHQTDDEQRDEHPAVVLMGGVINGLEGGVEVHALPDASTPLSGGGAGECGCPVVLDEGVRHAGFM